MDAYFDEDFEDYIVGPMMKEGYFGYYNFYLKF